MWLRGLLSCAVALLLCINKSSEYDGPTKKQGWQPYCPAACICHHTNVYCDNQKLRRVPRPFPANTLGIYLRNNNIRKVPYRRMRGLTDLKHLLLKANHIVEVDGHAFKDLKNLISLSLTDNHLSYLSPKIFQNQEKLQVLSLRNNRLRHVKYLFQNVRKVQLLNLANNRLKHITNDMLINMPLLRVLDLHGNNIKHIEPSTFLNLPKLRFLVLRDNDLGFIKFQFPKNTHLELLDLTNCNLHSMAEGLPSTINDLRLSENKIKEVGPNAFNTTKEIRLLVLNNNEIEKMHPKALAGLEQLYDLYLGKNRLTKIPYGLPRNIHGIYANFNNISAIIEGSFNYQSDLEFLFLRNNNIKKIEQTAFQGLHNLRSLDLSRNKIISLKPHTFSKLRTLELLDLSKNPIGELAYGCFHGLHQLTILQLSSVDMVDTKSLIPASSFRDMQNLRFLDLSNSASLVKKMAQNKITLKSLKSVEDLNMMNDLLKKLPSDFPNHFPLLRVIKLIGNPWHCDESIFWMTDWMRNRTITFYAPHFMVCATPKGLKGKQILTLRRDEVYAANKPTRAPKVTRTKTVPRKIKVDNLGVIFKIIGSNDKKYVPKAKYKRIPFRTRQGLSNTAIRITPGNSVIEHDDNKTNTSITSIDDNISENLSSNNLNRIKTNQISVKITPNTLIKHDNNNLEYMLKSQQEEQSNQISQYPQNLNNEIKVMESDIISGQIPPPTEAMKSGHILTKKTEQEDLSSHITAVNNTPGIISNNILSKISSDTENESASIGIVSAVNNINHFNLPKKEEDRGIDKITYNTLDSSDQFDKQGEISNVIQVSEFKDKMDDNPSDEIVFEELSNVVYTIPTPDEIELGEMEREQENHHVHTKRSEVRYSYNQNKNLILDNEKNLKFKMSFAGYPRSSATASIAYNDRIFENVEQAERFLLHTYNSAVKRKYNDIEKTLIKKDSVQKQNNEIIKPYDSQFKIRYSHKLRTEGHPMYDDSSGLKVHKKKEHL